MLVIHYIHSWYHMTIVTILQELADFEKNSATIFMVFMVKHGKTSGLAVTFPWTNPLWSAVAGVARPQDVARQLAFGNEGHTAPKGGGAAVDIQPVDMYILHMINIW